MKSIDRNNMYGWQSNQPIVLWSNITLLFILYNFIWFSAKFLTDFQEKIGFLQNILKKIAYKLVIPQMFDHPTHA